jgi:hypothetical protein
MLGEQGCGYDRQRGILVAGRLDRALEPVTALDDILDGRHGVLAVLLGGRAVFERKLQRIERGSNCAAAAARADVAARPSW